MTTTIKFDIDGGESCRVWVDDEDFYVTEMLEDFDKIMEYLNMMMKKRGIDVKFENEWIC